MGNICASCVEKERSETPGNNTSPDKNQDQKEQVLLLKRQNTITQSITTFKDKYRFVSKKALVNKEYKEEYLVQDQEGKKYLCTVCHKGSLQASKYYNQVLRILNEIDHINSINIHETYQEQTKHLIITRHYECNLEQLMEKRALEKKNFDQEEILSVAKQLLGLLIRFKKLNVVHGDIAPESIFLSSPNDVNGLRLGGYNYSSMNDKPTVMLEVEDSYVFYGYQAPELLVYPDSVPTHKSDIWSVGVIIFRLIFGIKAHPLITLKENVERLKECVRNKVDISQSSAKSSGNPSNTKQMQILLSNALNMSPESRGDVAYILEQLQIRNKLVHKKSLRGMSQSVSELAKLNPMQRMSLLFLIKIVNQQSEQQSIEAMFREMDTDGDGRITPDEMTLIFQKVFPKKAEEDIKVYVSQIFEHLDSDGNNSITFDEYNQLANIGLLEESQYIRKTFEFLDQDSSGEISLNELQSAFSKEDQGKVNDLFQKIDLDNNGFIDYEEFENFVKLSVQ